MPPVLRRDIKLSERGSVWIVLSILTTLLMLGALLAAFSGAFVNVDPYWFSANARGYTAIGLALGGFAIFFTVLSFAFSLRKRSMQEKWKLGRGTMMAWLWVHVCAGILAIVAATMHAGFGLFSNSVSTGKILYWVFFALVVSGVVWRMVYGIVPKIAAPRVGNYSEAGSKKRAQDLTTEIEKLAAGKSEALHRTKDWLLAAHRSPQEVAQAQVPPEERPVLAEIARLADRRHAAEERIVSQHKFVGWLQRWRVIHVPLSLLVVGLLVVHVIGALDLPQQILPRKTAYDGVLAAFPPAEDCKDCHRAIYDEWKASIHAHAMSGPMMVVQNNADLRTSLKDVPPDIQRFCINCHGPVDALHDGSPSLPMPNGALGNQGVTCTVCHQFTKEPQAGTAGQASAFQQNLTAGRTFYGPLADGVGNAYHKSRFAPPFDHPENICVGCHNVTYDRNQDGNIQKGVDLVLQQTNEEFGEYQTKGGTGTCISCHMPDAPGRVADKADIPFDQDFASPPRRVHDHSFIGVDPVFEDTSDSQRAKREAFLRFAASIAFDGGAPQIDSKGKLAFKISIANQTGHNLPTGFAFARQLWLEVVVKDKSGEVVFQSGVLAKPDNDLCDNSTFGEDGNQFKPVIQGCTEVDPNLVLLQTKLVDKISVQGDASGQPQKDERGELIVIQAKNGKETTEQYIEGGAVVRKRPVDNAPLAPLRPTETRSYGYDAPLATSRGGVSSSGNVEVRLLIRNLPPYFLRGLGSHQPANEQPRVASLTSKLRVVEIAKIDAKYGR